MCNKNGEGTFVEKNLMIEQKSPEELEEARERRRRKKKWQAVFRVFDRIFGFLMATVFMVGIFAFGVGYILTSKDYPSLRESFVRQFLYEGGPFAQNHEEELFAMLASLKDERELVLKTMSGVTSEEMRDELRSGPLTNLTRERRSRTCILPGILLQASDAESAFTECIP